MPVTVQNHTALALAFVPTSVKAGECHLSIVVKGTFSLGLGQPARPAAKEAQRTLSGDLHVGDDAAAPLLYPSDFAPYKPRADVILVGGSITRRAPGKASLVQLGAWHKKVGERGSSVASFGPVPAHAPERAAKMGTFDDAWLAQRWPWLPIDTDWGHFNAAPIDQQIEASLRGDEALLLEGLSLAVPRWETALPGLRPRCLLWRAISAMAPGAAEEVALKLDTVWIDVDSGELVLVWRGHVRVASKRFEDVARIALHVEAVAEEPLPFAHYRDLEEEPPTARREELLADREEAEARAIGRVEASPDEEEAIAIAEAREDLVRAGASKALLEQLAPARTVREFLAILASQGAPADEAAMARDRARRAAEGNEALALHGVDPAALADAPPDTERSPEVIVARPPFTRATLLASVAAREPLGAVDLCGLDLSGLDLRGVDLAGADLSAADLRGSDLSEANLGGAKLRGTSLAKTKLVLTDLHEADLTGADLDDADLTDAQLTAARLVGCTLRRVQGHRAQLRGADLSDADLQGAQLASANLTLATAHRARLDGATLREASLEGARGVAISMLGADLTGLRAAEATLPEADVDDAIADGSVWTGADLAGASFERSALSRADLSESNLTGASFHRAIMKEACLVRATLEGARLTSVDLFRGVLEDAVLTRADVRDANLFEAELLGATIEGARFDRTNLARTKLAATPKPRMAS